MKESIKIDLSEKGPQVLVIHTHTSEAYTPTKENNYIPSDPDRTEDPRYNIVRVGEEIVKYLEEEGISVVHDKTIHDYPSYNGSYQQSLKTIQAQLEKNPSIKIVLDIHRDGLTLEDGRKLGYIMILISKGSTVSFSGTDQGTGASQLERKFKVCISRSYILFGKTYSIVSSRYNQHATLALDY